MVPIGTTQPSAVAPALHDQHVTTSTAATPARARRSGPWRHRPRPRAGRSARAPPGGRGIAAGRSTARCAPGRRSRAGSAEPSVPLGGPLGALAAGAASGPRGGVGRRRRRVAERWDRLHRRGLRRARPSGAASRGGLGGAAFAGAAFSATLSVAGAAVFFVAAAAFLTVLPAAPYRRPPRPTRRPPPRRRWRGRGRRRGRRAVASPCASPSPSWAASLSANWPSSLLPTSVITPRPNWAGRPVMLRSVSTSTRVMAPRPPASPSRRPRRCRCRAGPCRARR